jgi:pimeloyl-ACP methyl ester carboxylesterase
VIGLATLLAACTIGGVPAQCGTVTVPENRALSNGPSISLSVAVLPATVSSARRADPVFYVTGGPGGASTESLPSIAARWGDVNAHRDIVFMDQRGVGGSNPLQCALASMEGSVPDLVAACLGQVHAEVAHYRTTDAMDDLDSVRQALGYGTINLWGGSYGATAVQIYLRRHPETVRTAMLDGVTLLDIPVFERWASSGQRALALLDKRCSADRGCRTAFPHWYARLLPMLRKLEAKPVTAGGLTIDAGVAADTIHEMTASTDGAAQVPYVVAKAAQGSFAPLARAVRGYGASPSLAIAVMPVEIMCTEPWAARDPTKVAADAAGTYLRYTEPKAAAQWQAICAAWPHHDTAGEDWSRVHSATPTLVLEGGADPKDPPQNAAGVSEAMPNSRVVLVPGGGHGVSTVGCVPVLLDRFLERGTVQGLDTSCAKLTPWPAFRLR